MTLRNLIGLSALHTNRDIESRSSKAERIIKLISLFKSEKGLRVLDFGAGTGLVAVAMQRILGETCSVAAADVKYRVMEESIPYFPSVDNRLPVNDAMFDLVVSNHVLEHVGDEVAQLSYLLECRRIVANDGLLYIAFPNRWTIFEPHYRTPFVSWPPEQHRDRFLAWLYRVGLVPGKHKLTPNAPVHYEMRPLSRRQIGKLLKKSGFDYKEITFISIKMVLILEFGAPQSLAVIGAFLIHIVLWPIVPTLSFTATPNFDCQSN